MVFMVRVPVFKKIKNEDCPPVYAGRRLHHNPHGRINAHGEGILLSGSPAVMEPKLFRPMTLRPAVSRGLPLSDLAVRNYSRLIAVWQADF
jgi:hypothetical protein